MGERERVSCINKSFCLSSSYLSLSLLLLFKEALIAEFQSPSLPPPPSLSHSLRKHDFVTVSNSSGRSNAFSDNNVAFIL